MCLTFDDTFVYWEQHRYPCKLLVGLRGAPSTLFSPDPLLASLCLIPSQLTVPAFGADCCRLSL